MAEAGNMEDIRAALSAKGYDIVQGGGDDDSDSDCGLPGRIPSLPPDVAREKGKVAFQKGKYDKAIKCWQGGLKSILSALCSGPEALSNQSLSELDLTLNLNIAMAYMKKDEFDSADRSVDKALARRDALPEHLVSKALYRKASAQRAMHRLDDCLETLKDLLEVDSSNAAGLQMKQEVDREWQQQNREQKNNLKKMWSKMEGENKKVSDLQKQQRAEARATCRVKWLDDDIDTAAFERDEVACCDGRNWELAFNRTVLWGIEQFSLEDVPCLLSEATHASIWYLGVSSTCELRLLRPAELMARLPGITTLELALVGFLGEKDPDNKLVADPKVDTLPRGVLRTVLDEGKRRAYVRVIHGTLQDALTKELKSDAATTSEATASAVCAEASAQAPADAGEADGVPAEAAPLLAVATGEAEAPVATSMAPAAAQAAESSADETAKPASDPYALECPPQVPPSLCVIAHPQLHRYYTDFFPAITWLIQHQVPTIVIGGSEPDLSWKQDEALLKALGATVVIGRRESPYPMCLPDNSKVRKCNHIIGFRGGKALDRDKLTKTKIELLSHDYSVV